MPDLTPYQLYQTYRWLDVPLYDGRCIQGLDIHEYRINNGADATKPFSTAPGLEAYDALMAEVKRHCTSLGNYRYRMPTREYAEQQGWIKRTIYRADIVVSWPDLQRPYIGKGNPEEIRQVLRLAVLFGILPANRGIIQNYCDANIGIDCSGFARAYYGSAWTKIADVYDKARAIKSLDEVRAGDALIWKKKDHVAVIDSIVLREKTSGITYSLTCKVAESTSDKLEASGPEDGLNYTEYQLMLQGGTDDFLIFRDLASSRNGYYNPAAVVRRLT